MPVRRLAKVSIGDVGQEEDEQSQTAGRWKNTYPDYLVEN